MFTSQPQVVEVYEAGTWWAGELLGWRHDENGSCQVWVRVVVGGVEHTAWTDLGALRLPERRVERPVEPVRRPAAREMPPRRTATAGGSAVETTASLPLARDHVAAESAPVRSGGRRRAPEVVAEEQVPEVQVARASSVPVPAPGRHRAKSAVAAAGRHRAADTGLFPAVGERPAPAADRSRADGPATTAVRLPTARPVPAQEQGAREQAWAGAADELLTRPMRLTDAVPHSRRPRLVTH